MHPDLADWRRAKRAAMALANAIGAEIVQRPDGSRVVLHAGRYIPCETWLGCYSYCYRIRCDQLGHGPGPPGRAGRIRCDRPVVRDANGRVIPYAEEV